jgi:ribosome-binding ATPase YchF (GTP1/OBG family)
LNSRDYAFGVRLAKRRDDMTPEPRLDRLERLAKLFVRAGRRARLDIRHQDEKINILIDLQMQNQELFARNEERFAKNEERFAKNEERFAKNEERFAKQDENIQALLELQKQNEERFARTDKRFVELAESQANSDRRLDSLIELIRSKRNGNS